MLNNGKLPVFKKLNVDQEFFGKIEELSELPHSEMLVLINKQGFVLYSNINPKNQYHIREGFNVFDLETEPDLKLLISNLSSKPITSFNCDLLVKSKNNFFEGFLLRVEKVFIDSEEIFIIYISSQNKKNKITRKVNSFNQALESVNVGVLIADTNAKIQYTSKSFEKIFKVRIESLFNEDILSAFRKNLSKMEIDELIVAINQKRNWKKIISEIDNQGNVNYFELKLNITTDGFDNSSNFIFTATNITDYVKQQRLIRKSEHRQRTIINNISDPILILRKEKKELFIENANTSFYNEIMSKESSKLGEYNIELLNPILHSVINEAIINLEHSNKKHSPFHYTMPKTNIRYLGKVTYTDDNYDNTRLYIVNMTDITEQLEIEKKLRDAYTKEISLNKLKSTFLANMSHEIRTPLNAIVGYSDLLEDDVKSMNYESSAKMAEYLKDGVNRLVKLVDNIVEVSLLESGNEEINFEIVDVNKIIKSLNDIWEIKLLDRNILLNLNLYKKPVLINASQDKLVKAINEIVDNAIKYNIDNGKVIVSTSIKNKNAIIEISDTGIGIEESSLNRIFELFEQVEDIGYSRNYEGAGLGLSLAKKIISFMGGTINIKSEPQKGTEISIIFPKS